MKTIAIILLSVFLLSTSGCISLPLKIGNNKSNITYSKTDKGTIIREEGYEEVAGKPKKYSKYYKEYDKGSEKSIPKKTLMQKVGDWISGLGFLAFILLGVGLFLAPTVTIGILFSILKRTRRAFIETVKAIKDVKADQQIELHNALNKNQSNETKQLVGEIKAKL